MDNSTKKHIKILAERFSQLIEYDRDILILRNDIRVWQKDKYGYNISFNLLGKHRLLKVSIDGIYNVVIQLLRRENNTQDVELKSEVVLTVEHWVSEEGDFAREQLEKLKKDLKTESIKYRDLGGNRYEAEFYNGILILTDDLCFLSSNIIEL